MAYYVQTIHDTEAISLVNRLASSGHFDTKFTYTFQNFFHPFVGDLISRLNHKSIEGMLDATWQDSLKTPDPRTDPVHDFFNQLYHPTRNSLTEINHFRKEIDVSDDGIYSNYNWELLFHLPLTVATHLSKVQRFAEAQKWFHYIFDPTSTDVSIPVPARFWKFLRFRNGGPVQHIDEIVRLLSVPRTALNSTDQAAQDAAINGYRAVLDKPFQPHAVARSRPIAYQYSVVMKYLDNLIAWGDSLFLQDTIESINEATQIYVLAANILGERPQPIPPTGSIQTKTFAQLRSAGIGPIGNALVDLEAHFPFNLSGGGGGGSGGGSSSALFGIGRSLYFCLPPNEKMLGYWDIVADRLFKIRNSMNLAGIVRTLALFDPPIDPGMLVKAAAAGIDIGSIVSGLNQPIGPVRCLTLIQKSLELCGEVRNLGGTLLSAHEKGDAEHLATIRQRHEIMIQTMSQEVRFLQWKSAQESTKSLLTARATALERLRYYQRLLGLPEDPNAPEKLTLNGRDLTEENFDEQYSALVGTYDKTIGRQKFPQLTIAGGSSPGQQSGASGKGNMYLNANEDAELNNHLPTARDTRLAASTGNIISSVLTFIPEFNLNLHFWGCGGSSKIFGGSKLSDATKIASEILQTISAWEQDQAGLASRAATYQRRADDWLLQYNLAAHELMQNGRQILTSLISEQIARHEYENIQKQIENSQEIDQFLHDKFTNEELYLWMQGEISRLYYEYYRFAFDTARKAERTMKQELMRPELDAQDFVKFNYWDGGRKGLLSGEALHLDVKKMEMAYLDNNKRELELTRHVSLRQLDPIALLSLKMTGRCQVNIPEWLFDRDCPGHYGRRIKNVALSIPSVVGPYTSVHCTLSLLKSSVRKSPIAGASYARSGSEDTRFVDYTGAIQSIVTSNASNDSGMFETNLREDRFLPFEGAGAISTWQLELPKPTEYPAFDYKTISDVILHIRYTARQGVAPSMVVTSLNDLFSAMGDVKLPLLFSLSHDFPMEWSAFVKGTGDLSVKIKKDYFPYVTQGKTLTLLDFQFYGANLRHQSFEDPTARTADLLANKEFTLTSAPGTVLKRAVGEEVFLVLRFSAA